MSAALAPAVCVLTAAACAAGAGWIARAPEEAAWMADYGAALAAVMAALWAGAAMWMIRRSRSERLAAILVRAWSAAMERGEPAPTPMPVPGGLRHLDETLRGLHGAAARRDGESLDLLASNRLLARELRVLQALIDLPSIGIIAVDNLGRVILANRAAYGLLKREPEPPRGRPIEECFAEPELIELVDAGRDAESARAPRTLELPPDAASGRGHLTVTRWRGFDAGRAAIGQVILIRDETGVKSAESTRARFVESVDSFTRELRMPIGVIGAYLTELTQNEGRSETHRRSLYTIMQGETDRLGELLDKVLNLSMLESGLAQLDRAPTPIGGLIGQAVDLARIRCEKKGIILDAALSDRLPTLDVDPTFFDFALGNVLGNAVKFTPPGGSISVRTSSHEDQFSIHVRDTGPGIAAEHLNHVFDKFFTQAPPGEAESSGTGTGLTLALRILRMHGGDIRAISQPGQGSEFILSLPREATAPAPV